MCLRGQSAVVGTRPGRVVELGREHVVAALAEELAEQPSGDLFAGAPGVHVGGVEECHAGLYGVPDDGFGRVLGQVPRLGGGVSVAHHAQADPRHLQTGRA
jgi:hypothetical protein